MPVNLLDFDAERLAGFFTEIGEKPFRARQVMRWIHQFGQSEFDSMSDLSKDLRAKLVAGAMVQAPCVTADSTAADGTRKWLLSVGSANGIETVFIPESSRGTLCISSQVGCARTAPAVPRTLARSAIANRFPLISISGHLDGV